AFLLPPLHSAVEVYDGCASIIVTRFSDYDLVRRQNGSEGSSLKFLEFTDKDLKEIPKVKKLVEAIGDRIEYHTHSYATVPIEEIEVYRKYLSDKYEAQYDIKPDFKEYGVPFFLYNGKTYWINLGGYYSEYYPTREMVVEIQHSPQKNSIVLTDEDFLVLSKIKDGIEDIGKFETSPYNYTGLPEYEWHQYQDYFQQKSSDQFGNETIFTNMFHYNEYYYEAAFAIC
ncbi:MAG: hypothetical protein ACRD94_05300, partial [Nitrosopumilaceae archaeon]